MKLLIKPGLAALCFSALLAIAGCSKSNAISPTVAASAGSNSVIDNADADDLVEASAFRHVISISFGNSVTINNPVPSGVNITINGSDVIITSSLEGVEYKFTGASANASVKINSTKQFKLTLNGLNISNDDGPAIAILSAQRTFLVLADDTQNSLADGEVYTTAVDGEQQGAIISKGQLVFSGNGSLTLQGNKRNGIASSNYVRVRSGHITVTNAVEDGVHVADSFITDGGAIAITAKNDAIACDEGAMLINDGLLELNTLD